MLRHNAQGAELFKCSGCRGWHTADLYNVDRHGNRRKTCLHCAGRVKPKCPHGRQRSECKTCAGVGICPHERLRYQCWECGGASICPCGRQRSACFSCDPVSALWHRASERIITAIGTEARAGRSTAELLGCDKDAFYRHIEAQFVGEMSWPRIGEIDIDHRVPIEYRGAAGGPPTLDEKVARLDYRNCQPLWAHDNRVKGNRRADELPPAPALTDAERDELLAAVLL